MRKERIGRTAQVNLKMLADVGIPEAVAYQHALNFDDDLLAFMPKTAATCIASISDTVYFGQ